MWYKVVRSFEFFYKKKMKNVVKSNWCDIKKWKKEKEKEEEES
jgi:hypothetical protein